MGEIWSGERSLDLGELNDRAARAASGLSSLGIGPGDTVALYLRNDFPLLEGSFAAGRLGAYAVPVNWHCTPTEASYLLQNCGARVVVIHADLYEAVKAAIPDGIQVLVAPTPPEIAVAYRLAPEVCKVPSDKESWGSWLEGFAPHQHTAEAPGAIIYTSGTTGQPKGVRRAPPTAAQAAASQRSGMTVFGLDGRAPADIVAVVTGPMYHSSYNSYGLLMARMGATVILQPRFDAEALLKLVQQRHVTHLHMAPIMFNRLLKLPEDIRAEYDVSSLEFVVHAAAPCPPQEKRAMIDWWGPLIHEYYGSTEIGAAVMCSAAEWLAHPSTVGRPLPDVHVRIIDPKGRELPAGEVGEIVAINSATADFTYHQDDQKRRDSEKYGLIAPGDVGYIDDDGFLYLRDRSKDMIISGGVNIYPAEIEAELHTLPGVEDCAVFGIPDDEYGEAVCAVVQPRVGFELSESDVRAFLRERVAGYKLPRRVEFAAELPREDSGKIFKRKLREPFWAGLERRI